METTTSFQWLGATVTVRRSKVRDRMTTDAIQTKIAGADAPLSEKVAAREYGRICAQSTVSGNASDLGFPLLRETDSDADLRAAFDLYLDADEELSTVWNKAIQGVNAKIMPSEKPNPKDEASAASTPP